MTKQELQAKVDQAKAAYEAFTGDFEDAMELRDALSDAEDALLECEEA